MGIQAFVRVQDLADAVCRFERFSVVEYMDSLDDTILVDAVSYYLRVEFPDGETFVFHDGPHEEPYESVWTDFNHWGQNRRVLQPLLLKYGINWREF